MRNALGLMVASVVAAVAIAGVWFWTSSPRADAAPPQTIAARKAEPLAPAKAAKDDVQTTAALSMKPQAAPAPAAPPPPPVVVQKPACANPDALATFYITSGLAPRYEAKVLHPLQGKEAKAVVHEPDIHVLGTKGGIAVECFRER